MTDPNWLVSIHHDGSEKYVSSLHPNLGDTVRLRLRMAHDVPVNRVILRTFPDGEQSFGIMQRTAAQAPVQWWEIDLPIAEPLTHYRFIIDSADGLWHYTAAGPSRYVPLDATDFRILADYQPPAWLGSAVFYQIFPDRFANGDPTNDPQPDEYEYRGQSPKTYPWEAPPDEGQFFPLVFYGGDLAGINSRLDYLADLGINALYLNPLFYALSNHKYDVADYERVDPHFGGNEALVSLRQALSARGMRYILDIVPNHCGYWHPWFQTALTNAESPETEFFTFNRHPDDYTTWLGVWVLPKLNYRSHELRHRIYQGTEAVFRSWLRPPYSADGWRVDVANMLGRQGATQIGLEISRGIRQAVKETRLDAYLMGENFFDATAQLQGDQWDGVMNYGGIAQPMWYWLSGFTQGAHGFNEIMSGPQWPSEAVVGMWQSRMAVVPWAIALQQYNILDSHDTPRIRTLLGENDALHRLAVALLLTFPGVPGLYYGDEIGMTDVPELGARGCMVWDESRQDRSLHEYHKRLIHFRRNSTALQRGGFQVLAVEPDTIAYQRESIDERIIVVAHRAEMPRAPGPLPLSHTGVADGTQFIDLMSGTEFITQEGMLSLPALPQGVLILLEA